jgi:hypothetical protein
MTDEPAILRCPLCTTYGAVRWDEAESMWLADCAICGRFGVDAQLMTVIRTGLAERDDRVCSLLPWLSKAAQERWHTGDGYLRLRDKNWQEIAHDAKAKHNRPE